MKPTTTTAAAAAAVAVNNNGDGMEEASRLVESIHRQLTEGDAPSGNFDNYPDITTNVHRNNKVHHDSNIITHCNNDGASTTASEPSVSSSSVGGRSVPIRPKQLRFPPRPPPTSDHALTRSSTISNSNSSSSSSKHHQDMSLSIICSSSSSSNTSFTIGSELMGTSALADLCSQTVESIARNHHHHHHHHDSSSSRIISENIQQPSLQQPNINNEEQQQDESSSNFLCDDTDIINMGSFSFEVEEEGESTKNNKTAKTTSLTSTEGSIMEQSTAPIIESNEHNGPGRNNNQQKRRTVMFGSEYARILSSSSPLSPSNNNGQQRSNNARRMKQSIKARFTSSASSSSSTNNNNNNNNKDNNKDSVESGGRNSLMISLDDCPIAVATAAITDVIITSGTSVLPPKGYYRAFPIGKKKDELLYVNVKKEPNWDRAVQRPCVTAICVIYPDRNEFVPPGFSVVRYYEPNDSDDNKIADNSNSNNNTNSGGSLASPANVNPSSSGERVYLCYRRSREGNPLTGLTCLQPSKGDVIPEGYTVLEKTPRNFLADMTANSDLPLFLAYRQRLENLECLRPLPLVLSVLQSKQDLCRKELKAYYCTGGTVVASDVGRLHIMDRSTHNILSSSSAQSRLNLIQMAREGSSGSGTAVPSWITNTSSHSSLSSQIKEKSEGSTHSFGSEDPTSFFASSSFGDANSVESSPSQRSVASSLGTPNSKLNSPLLRQFDDTVQTSLDTMHFIPSIECANSIMAESVLQSRIAIISPILTACYTSQGGSALVAVEGLTKLLNDTDFFAQDVADANNVIGASSRLTLIDLAVQVVCDVATTTSRETYFRSCVDFVSDAVRYADGRLNDRTTGFIMRFYLFVYYFGASVPTSGWPFIRDDYLLSDEIGDSIVGVYLPGGAPQAAAIALREFVSIMLASTGTEKEEEDGDDKSGPSNTEDETNSVESQSRVITSNSAEDAIDRVDLANYIQLALYQIHRSGGSELFWHDMINQCGMGLFGSNEPSNQVALHANIISFAILASFVKIAAGKVRIISKNADPVPRDVASKLLSLELLFHFIKMWHAAVCPEERDLSESTIKSEINDTKATTTMVYLIRRMVVPTMLSNTSASIEDCRVYKRVLRITSQLWCTPYYRRKMKVDLAILIEHFVLKILCLGPQINPPKGSFEDGSIPNESGEMPSLLNQQLDVLEELKAWFSNPKAVLDLFVNYDSPEEMLPSVYCKLLNKLIEALCTLGEKCATIVSDHGRFTSISASPKRSTPLRKENDMAHVREAALAMRNKCFDVIALVVKSMMDCSDNLPQNQHQLLHSQHSKSDSSDIGQSFSNEMSPPLAMLGITDDENIVDYWHTSIGKRKASLHPMSAPSEEMSQSTASLLDLKRSRSDDSRSQRPESLETAFELISRKGLKKGIDFLIAKNLLTRSPKHVSSFLRVHQSSIDPIILGEYLGEGGTDGIDKDYWNLIRFYYFRAVSFVGMNIEKALRHFLTSCGFRLPGEAQRIDRVISTFSQCYWEDNAGDMANCPFQDQDTCFLVSFAIIMLNTDLHKSQPAKSKTLKRMTRSEFIANLRHVCAADKFQSYIYDIYDAIEMTPILVTQNNSPQKEEGKKKRRGQGPTSSLPFKHDTDYATSLQAWVKSAKSTQELLRTLADQNDDDFTSIDDQDDEDMDLWYVTHQMFSANWHHIHGLINTTVENAHIDISGLDAAIAALEYSLCTASYLDMTTELAAFNKLLERLNRFNGLKIHKEEGPGHSSAGDETSSKDVESSLANIENPDQVRSVTKQLQTSLFVDDTKVQTMKLVANRIRNGEVLLNDPSRTFVRESDLIKRHQLAGRSSTYRFFLFSDVLVYAHKSSQGDYVVHEELPLHLMKIEDIVFQSSKSKHHSFFIHHPNKSFAVITSGKAEKKLWTEDIKNSISCEINRKAKVEGARLERVKKSAKKGETKTS